MFSSFARPLARSISSVSKQPIPIDISSNLPAAFRRGAIAKPISEDTKLIEERLIIQSML